MYTIVERRKVNPERLQETMQRAESEFFPKLRTAPGFTGFYVVADEAQGINVAIVVWESQAQADTFETENSAWLRTLEELGHALQTDNRGESVVQLEPAR
jgi:heme-degrading monooxygenase HmoA